MPSLGRALVAMLLLISSSGSLAFAASKPNFVVILADDLGYSDLGCYGGEIPTPVLDALARRGLRFTQFYNTARCWPSRASLLTGYYAQQVNRDPAKQRPIWAALLPQLLAKAGYRSYHTGKWHVDGPVLEGGFRHSYRVDDLGDHFTPPVHYVDDQPLPKYKPGDSFYSSRIIADHAVKWLEGHQAEHRGEPFFLYVPFTAPHFPLHGLQEDIDRHRDDYKVGWDVTRDRRWKKMKTLGIFDGALSPTEPDIIPSWNLEQKDLTKRVGPGEVARYAPWETLNADQRSFQATKMAIHAAMVDRMDREIGRILKQVEAMGATDNTLVVFASDNGASAEQIIRGGGHDPSAPPGSAKTYLCLAPAWANVANTPFRLSKHYVHEGGIATPLIVAWPNGIKSRGQIRHTPGHLVDLAPTLLELAGLNAPDTWNGHERPPLPGRSLVEAFDRDATIPRDFLYFSHSGNRALRAGDWKIAAVGKDGPWELYDLAHDRTEIHNLAAEHPEKVKELVAKWKQADQEYRKQGETGPRMTGTAKNVKP